MRRFVAPTRWALGLILLVALSAAAPAPAQTASVIYAGLEHQPEGAASLQLSADRTTMLVDDLTANGGGFTSSSIPRRARSASATAWPGSGRPRAAGTSGPGTATAAAAAAWCRATLPPAT